MDATPNSSRPPVWISHYQLKSHAKLNSASSRREFNGVLIRIGAGFGCIHPWPELGDPTLQKCLEDLAGERRWPIVRRAVRCAEMDGVSRENDDWLFEEMEIPASHATLVSKDAATVVAAVEAGFTTIKLKASRDLAAVGKFLNEQVAAFPKLMWRLDFNESSEATEMAEFLKSLPDDTRRRIDFIEDPCPYSETTWTTLKQTTGARLAVDREAAPNCDAAQVMVLKPALDEPWLLAEAAAKRGRQLVVTSYMDHPLGQCFAAWEAARLGLTFRGLVPVCGLQTHHLFEPNAFSDYLGSWSPTFQPAGGKGLGFDDLLDALVWTRLV
jgi:O-succinylbenzoate synthase